VANGWKYKTTAQFRMRFVSSTAWGADLVPGLRIRVSACIRKKGEKTTYRIPRKQLEDSLEVTANVGFDEFPNI
jgi:hypothetical protein